MDRPIEPSFLWQCIDSTSDGIFAYLALLEVPWAESIDAGVLDNAYLDTYSGGKPPAPLIRRWYHKNEDAPLTSEQLTSLSQMLYAINGASWIRLWEAEVAPYEPLENYAMLETLEDEKTHSEEGTETTDYGSTDTRTDNLTLARTGTERHDVQDNGDTVTGTDRSVYGMNSSTAVPSDSETATSTMDAERLDILTRDTRDSHTGTQATARTGEDEKATAKESTDTHSYTLTRTGNIGTVTAQDMLAQEREIRAWKIFTDRVFPDIDKMLTLCTY